MAKTALPGSGGTGDVAGGVLHASDIDRLPGGWLDYSETTTPIAADSVTTILTLTVTVNGSRKIRITGSAPFASGTIDDDFVLGVYEGGTRIGAATLANPNIRASSTFTAQCSAVVSAGTAGSHTFVLQGGRYAGTGPGSMIPAATRPAWLLVEDIGPS